MLIDFEHNNAAHCENGVTSNLLKFHGINLSEAMVFGLGSGIYFAYLPFIKVNGCPGLSFRPMPGVIFKRISKAFGIKRKVQKFKDSEKQKAREELDKNLAKGIPTGMVVGVYNLTYFPPMYRFHFNAHNIVCIGFENGRYIISDPVMEKVESLSPEELEKVRFAKGVMKPHGKMYQILSVPKTIDLKTAIIRALKRTVRENYSLPGPIIGVKGIEYLSKRVRKWPKKYGEKNAARFVGNVVRMQEEIGTGGAGFRFLFAAFLQEAAVVLGEDRLRQLSFEMTEVGDLWRDFAVSAGRICKGRQTTEDYDTLGDMLLEISKREAEVFRKIRNIVK